tara:strand:+ start:587 stop:841 length:255 start_codon:yes stop_codon:yes gene_type:complete
MSVSMNVKVDDYTSRVLGVIKEKFGLRDKAEALDRFAEMFGEEFIEKQVKEEVVNKMIHDCENWKKKHKFKRKMSIKELDRLCG